MNIKAVFPGQYLQGRGILNALPELVQTFGNRGLILASPTAATRILPAMASEELRTGIPVERFNGECCDSEIERVGSLIRSHRADILIAMGGGKVIDTAKIAANRANLPVIIVPTIASTDAPCSGCAVVYTCEGEFLRVDYQKRNPTVVLVDLDILVQSPVRFLVAGMGDALATWFEARSCVQNGSPNECGGLSTRAGLYLSRLCFDTLLEFGLQAKLDNENQVVTQAFSHIAEANILLSGLGFESSGLAAAHAIHNGLTSLPETHSFYHGEKVAIGTLAGLYLNESPQNEIEEVLNFCRQVGLPTSLAQIGLNNPSDEDLIKVAHKTCEPGSSVHHEAGIITPERVLNALKLLTR